MQFLFVVLFVTAINIFFGGYVVAVLWGWFMVPLGVIAITYWHAVGLGALWAMFMGSRGIVEKDEDLVLAASISIGYSIVIPATCLAIGWLAKINL